MGTHDALLSFLEWREKDLQGQDSGHPEPPPDWSLYRPGEPHPGGMTSNFLAMGRANALLWALANPTSPRAAEYRALWSAFMDRQDQEGHMLGEQTCAAPHYCYHLYPALLVFEGLHKAVEQAKDAVDELASWYRGALKRIVAWLRGHMAIITRGASDDGRVCLPGMRFKLTTVSGKGEKRPIQTCWESVTPMLRELAMLRHDGNARKDSWGGWDSFRDFACCRVMRRIKVTLRQALGLNALGQAALVAMRQWAMPRIAIEMTITRGNGKHTAELTRPVHAELMGDEVCSKVVANYALPAMVADYEMGWGTKAAANPADDVE